MELPPMQRGKPLPLLGCKACITQYNTLEERTRLPELLREAGASYTADLYKDCTHLLAKVPAGDKYKYARTWGGIQVVSADWLEESLRTGVRQDESKYAVLPDQPSSRSRGRGDSSKDSAAQPQHASLRYDPNSATHAGGGTSASVGSASIYQPSASSACPLPNTTSTHLQHRHAQHASGATNPAAVAQVPGTHVQGSSASAPRGVVGAATQGAAGRNACNCAGNAGGEANGDGSTCIGAQKGATEVSSGQGHQGVCGSEEGTAPDTLYMDFVRYHPLGVTAGENMELRRLVGSCGAIREASLGPRVTHVLVGSEPSSAELQAVRDHMAEWRDQVRVVRLQWVRDCCVQGQYIEPDAGACLTAAALMPKGQMAPASSLGPNGPSAAASREPWGLASSASMDPWDTDTRSRAAGLLVAPEPPLPPEQGRALQGLFFTLAAVEGTETEQIAGRLIKSQGGMLLGRNSIRLTDSSRAYAICPHGMPEHVVIDLCRRSGEFRHVPKGQRGTLLWLQECLRTLRLVPPNVYGQPAFHPMPFHLPLKSFENARVHISGYSPDMRAAIASLIEILGGRVTQEFSKVNTYLLVANASGKKYETAVKWGIPAVNEMWIITSAYSGQPCDAWMPKARPKGETEGMMQVAFHNCRMRQMQNAAAASNSHTATTNSGSQSIGFEQLPGTQFPGTQHPTPPARSHAPTISSLLNGNTSFGAAAAAAAAAAPNTTIATHSASGAAAVAISAAPENSGSVLANSEGAAAAAGRMGAADRGGCNAAPPPKKRMGLLEAMDAMSEGEESALPPAPAPNREVTFTGSGFRVIDSSTEQAMPPPPPRPAAPPAHPPSASGGTAANGGVLAPPPLQPLRHPLSSDALAGVGGDHAAAAMPGIPIAVQQNHQPSASPQQHPLHAGVHAHHPAGQAVAATTGAAATGATGTGAAGIGASELGETGDGAYGAQALGSAVGDGASREGDVQQQQLQQQQQQQQQQQLQQQGPVGQEEGEAAGEAIVAGAEGSQGSDSMDSSQPDNKDQLQIEQLLQAAPAGGLDGSCSQFDEPLLTGNGTNGGMASNDGQQGGPWAVRRGESSVSLGGGKEMSHTSSGGGGTRGTDGDAVSKPARRKRGAAAMEPPPPPAHPTHQLRQRGRIVTRRETETQEDVLQVEMSQQVGYDAGQRASDRLTGSRTRSSNNARGNAAGSAGGGVVASESQAAAKISLITRLRQKG